MSYLGRKFLIGDAGAVGYFEGASDPTLDANNRVTAKSVWLDTSVSPSRFYERSANNLVWLETSGQDAFSTVVVDGVSLLAELATDTLTINTAGGLQSSSDAGTDTTTLSLTNTAVTPGTYGSDTAVAQITVDQKGRITNATNVTIPDFVSGVLSATQANSTTTPDVLTGHTIVIPPGRTLMLTAQMAATSSAGTNGIAYGLRVAQAAGANGNAQGSVAINVAITSAAANSALMDGDVFNVAANANALVELLATASTAGNNYASLQATIVNRSTNVNTTVTVVFRSENAGRTTTAQIGTGFSGVIH